MLCSAAGSLLLSEPRVTHYDPAPCPDCTPMTRCLHGVRQVPLARADYRPRMSRFSGKRAIVTGGGRGIGEAVARRLYDEGASVMVVSRTEAEVGSVASALGERALAHVADVSLEADVQGIVDRALEVWGRIDVVVNNAGIDDDCPFLEVQAESWQRVLGVNLTGPFLVSQRAARAMAASGGGAFVHIASIAALAGDGEQVAYGASKAGLLGLNRIMALELARHGIRSNVVHPGLHRHAADAPVRRRGDVRVHDGRLRAHPAGPHGAARGDRRGRRVPRLR